MSFRMSLRTSDSEVKQSIKITRLPRRPPNRRTPRNDIYMFLLTFLFILGFYFSFPKLLLPHFSNLIKRLYLLRQHKHLLWMSRLMRGLTRLLQLIFGLCTIPHTLRRRRWSTALFSRGNKQHYFGKSFYHGAYCGSGNL